jgi:hypothetical protein
VRPVHGGAQADNVIIIYILSGDRGFVVAVESMSPCGANGPRAERCKTIYEYNLPAERRGHRIYVYSWRPDTCKGQLPAVVYSAFCRTG